MDLVMGCSISIMAYKSIYFIHKMASTEQLRNLIIQLLQAMSEGENILQCIKEALILHEEFNPVVLFQSLSRQKQKITKGDLCRFLESQNVQFSDTEIREYMSNNNFGKEITFNRFLDSIIPYNADALRAYKDNYLAKLSIRQLDDEVEFIFRELMENQLKFARVLNQIKHQIVVNCKAGIAKVARLIKNDLVHNSKPREGRKFLEKFESANNDLSFMDIRRFLELWRPRKQVMLLNLMRFLRSSDPLKPINLKLHETLKKSGSARSLSVTRGLSAGKNLQGSAFKNRSGVKKSQSRVEELNLLSRSRQKPDSVRKDIYEEYRQQVLDEFQKEQMTDKDSEQAKGRKVEENQAVRKTRWQREKKGVDGYYLKKVFQAIVTREERLQKLRKKLFKTKQLNLINLWKLVDKKGVGIVNAEDIRQFVNRQYGADIAPCNTIVNHFCREPGVLRFSEFCDIFRPLSKELNQTVSARAQNPVPNPFRNETNRLISEIIRTTLDMLLQLRQTKQKINDLGQDVRDMFRWVDLEEKGYLTPEDIKQVLEEDQFFCDLKDMKLIMRHFRKRIQDKIQLPEFRKFLEP